MTTLVSATNIHFTLVLYKTALQTYGIYVNSTVHGQDRNGRGAAVNDCKAFALCFGENLKPHTGQTYCKNTTTYTCF